MNEIINTENAPAAVGSYSQAVKAGNTLYLSGQIGMDPKTGELVSNDVSEQAKQMFENLKAVAQAAGADLNDVVKLTIYLVDMVDYTIVNETMQQFWQPPYPARACIAVKALPKNARIEADAIIVW